MLELKNVSVTLDEKILDNISMTITKEKGVVLGPNGSGKTTLIKSICGMLPYEGEIFIDGNELRKIKGFTKLSTNIPEAFSIGERVKDILYLYSEFKDIDEELFLSMIKEINIKDVLNKQFYKLSAGQSLIVRNALALASRPKIAILDEPFENVDAPRRSVVVRWIKEYGEEGFFVTHEIDMLKSFSNYNLYFLILGKIYGPVKVNDVLSSSIVEGEMPESLISFDINGKKISLVKGDKGLRFDSLGSLNRIYRVIPD
ncbi:MULTISPECIES: ATP-binding cassette domain-containing protein [Acidianus]|uniref:ABC transporter ATPase n=1 Tax=Candidatus Acidianus copahuensis TaxID=1160895 RepID=A0A031LW51_9CREN|nr:MULTISPECIES: ATP-binding cassette domain-containing protein [Acidianus]EZQ11383.1 ABC transporter ATPase [Candidatus Acidianus copahuensis]NON61472.1 ATP-binding cassette domain-containing protein [Acidianus sp. RZ1]